MATDHHRNQSRFASSRLLASRDKLPVRRVSFEFSDDVLAESRAAYQRLHHPRKIEVHGALLSDPFDLPLPIAIQSLLSGAIDG